MIIRPEICADSDCIFQIHAAAFETEAEARLVNALRLQASPVISLVAEDQDGLIGHIMFSPVTSEASPQVQLMGLAPMAVFHGKQNRGIGATLVREGLARCRDMGCAGVVVLGHPGYYPRFGFFPASRYGIRSEYDAPDEAFMAMELIHGALACVTGLVRYHEAFKDL